MAERLPAEARDLAAEFGPAARGSALSIDQIVRDVEARADDVLRSYRSS